MAVLSLRLPSLLLGLLLSALFGLSLAVRDVDCGHRGGVGCTGGALLHGSGASQPKALGPDAVADVPATAAATPPSVPPARAASAGLASAGATAAPAAQPPAPPEDPVTAAWQRLEGRLVLLAGSNSSQTGGVEEDGLPTIFGRSAAQVGVTAASLLLALVGLAVGCTYCCGRRFNEAAAAPAPPASPAPAATPSTPSTGASRGATSRAAAAAGDVSDTAAGLATSRSHEADGESSNSELQALRRKKMHILMEQAVNRQKLERVVEAMLAYEGQLKEEAEPGTASAGALSFEEAVRRKTEEAISATDMLAERKFLSGLAYLAPVFMQSTRVYSALQKRAQEAQVQAAKLALEQTKGLCGDLQEIFGVDDLKSSLFKTLSSVEAPSLATLMASAFAPAQLRVMHLMNRISTMQVGLFVLVSLFVLAVDWQRPCASDAAGTVTASMVRASGHSVQLWFFLDIIAGGLCLLIRLWVWRRVSTLLEDIDEPPPLLAAEDHGTALRMLLDYYMTTGCEALVKLDQVLSSYLYSLANWTVLFNFFLLLYGVEIVFNTTWKSCHTFGLVILRTRTVFFLILLLPNLIGVVLFFLWRFLESERFQIRVMAAADGVDEFLGLGVPVAGIVAQAIMIRNKRDMVYLQLRMYEMKKAELKKKQADTEKSLRALVISQERAEKEIRRLQELRNQEAKLTDQQRRQRQMRAKDDILQGAEEVFRKINEKAREATTKAEEQVKQWEEGEGHELLQAMSRGEGLATLKGYASKVNVKDVARGALQGTQALVADLAGQEWIQETLAKAVAQGTDLAHAAAARAQELAHDERVTGALQRGLDVVEDLSNHEGVKKVLVKGQAVAQTVAESEKFQKVLVKGQAVAQKVAESEKFQKVLVKGQAVAQTVAESEKFQKAVARGKEVAGALVSPREPRPQAIQSSLTVPSQAASSSRSQEVGPECDQSAAEPTEVDMAEAHMPEVGITEAGTDAQPTE